MKQGGDTVRYISENALHDFEFHDAAFTNGSFADTCLTFDVRYLNIHKDAVQNPFDTDMEIDVARITFYGFKVLSYEPGRAHIDDPPIIFRENEAVRRFVDQLNEQMDVFDLYFDEDGFYYMDAMSVDPLFTIGFRFDRVTIEWDACNRKAWYVRFAYTQALLDLKGDLVSVAVDRPLGSHHPEYKDLYYPINYGYIQNTLSGDGEEADAYILGVDKPLSAFTGRVIAVIHRLNDEEDKLVVAPDGMVFSKEEIRELTFFQEQYFNIEIEM